MVPRDEMPFKKVSRKAAIQQSASQMREAPKAGLSRK
jgi:hypothetical protein